MGRPISKSKGNIKPFLFRSPTLSRSLSPLSDRRRGHARHHRRLRAHVATLGCTALSPSRAAPQLPSFHLHHHANSSFFSLSKSILTSQSPLPQTLPHYSTCHHHAVGPSHHRWPAPLVAGWPGPPIPSPPIFLSLLLFSLQIRSCSIPPPSSPSIPHQLCLPRLSVAAAAASAAWTAATRRCEAPTAAAAAVWDQLRGRE